MSLRLISIFLLSTGALCAQAQPAYPVVSKAEQKARDEDRRPLLEAELASELEALAKAKTALANDQTNERFAAVHRHEENINGLRRELGVGEEQNAALKRERLVVRAVKASADIANLKRTPTFWDPYNRAPDSTDLSTTTPRRDSHE
jgi:hypothetical protein